MSKERIEQLERELEELKQKDDPFYGHPMFDKIRHGGHELWGVTDVNLKQRNPSVNDIMEFARVFKPDEMRFVRHDCFIGFMAPEQRSGFLKGKEATSDTEVSPFILQVSEFSTQIMWFTRYNGKPYRVSFDLPKNRQILYTKRTALEPGFKRVYADGVDIAQKIEKLFGSTGVVYRRPTGSLGGEYGRHYYVYWENAVGQKADILSFLELYTS
jgi:hypothetical protein